MFSPTMTETFKVGFSQNTVCKIGLGNCMAKRSSDSMMLYTLISVLKTFTYFQDHNNARKVQMEVVFLLHFF